MGKLSTFLITLLAATGAIAQSDTDWPVNCSADQCSLTRRVAESDGPASATLLIGIDKDSDEARIGIAVPLGVALLPGARLLQGDDVIDLAFDVCFPDGCRALTTISTDDLDKFAARDQTELRFFVVQLDRPVALEIPLSGLPEAVADARKQVQELP
ncbi:invasion associated locus B family protein [Antarctobacter jejuensis]|uniref:invasion associated locus B family protein n=1 Tax=Antarctobacter jejuensis TaxID=1439938 RepID=UPI003FD03EA7